MRDGEEVKVEQSIFILKELLGSGAFGKVYKALNKSTQQIIAMKVQDSINEDELKVLGLMRSKKHKNLINILNFEQIGRKYFIAMEYCKESLYDRIVRRGTIQPDDIRFIMKEIGNGIKEIHDLGYAHRDLKPENVLIFQVTENGQTQDLYKICDFGTIKKIDVLKTQKVGTAYYLAPEQVNGQDSQYSQKVDIWAFGALIYELLTGQPLFNGANELEVYYKIKNASQKDIDQKINDNLKMERKYRTLLLNTLQIDIRKRYDINQVVADLRGTSQTRDKIEFQGIKGPSNVRVLEPKGEVIRLPNPNYFQQNNNPKPKVVEQQQQKPDPMQQRGRNIEQSDPTKKAEFRSPQPIKSQDNPMAIRATINPSTQFKQQGPTQITSLSQETKFSQAIHQNQNTTFNQNQVVTKLSNNQKIDNFLQNNSSNQSSFQSKDQQYKNPVQQQQQQQQPFQNQIPVQSLQNQQQGYFLQKTNQQFDEQQQNEVVKRPYQSSQISNQLQNANQKQQGVQSIDQQQQNKNNIEQQSGKFQNQPVPTAFSNQQNSNLLQNTNYKQQSVQPIDQQQQNKNTIEQQSGKFQNQPVPTAFSNQQNNNSFQDTNYKQQGVQPFDQQQQNKNTIEQQSGKFQQPVPTTFPNQQNNSSFQNNNQRQQSATPYYQQQQDKPIYQQQQGTIQNQRASQPSQNLQNNGNLLQNTNPKQQSGSLYHQQFQNKNNIIQKEETIENQAEKYPYPQFQNSFPQNNNQKQSSQSQQQQQQQQQQEKKQQFNIDLHLPHPQNISSFKTQNQNSNNQQLSNNQPLNDNYFPFNKPTDSNNPQQPPTRLSSSQNQQYQPQKININSTSGSGNAQKMYQPNYGQSTSVQQVQSRSGQNNYQQFNRK